ncbi:MAG: sigma-54-dependent Fis family transcriptional regulator [Rubrivivax sp.]|nr:sigma-54-dependent Fis family transcriptional regulator [Rubrivivax sp.]
MAPVPAAHRTNRPLDHDKPAGPLVAGLPAHAGVIRHSHERCSALGLSRIGRPEHVPLARADLAVVRERHQRLHVHAAPVMAMLFDQIAGTQSMVVLCDASGTIIHSVGDDDFLSRAAKVALQPGVNWSEQSQGTNAIGTALMEEAPTLVHADEHFMHANHFLTCSATPILDPRGNILGVLDVTGDQRSYHPHTMALVRMSARMIENQWLGDDFRHAMQLHFHSRVDVIGTLMQGILAITPEGRIVGANRGALEQLRLSGAALRKLDLQSLLGVSVATLVDRFRSPLSTPLLVRTAAGQALYLHARFDWPVWRDITQRVVVPVHAAASKALPPAADAGLDALDTGDAQVAALVARLKRVVDHGVPILVQGDTGTGKACLVRALHRHSARRAMPLVQVTCVARPGAAGDAGLDAQGLLRKLQQAQGGTLWLAEVAELPLPLQGLLLQVLQTGQLTPPGADAPVPLDVAWVSSTRRALPAPGFDASLLHHLSGLAVTLPPLRQRSDLAALVQALLPACGATPTARVADATLALLAACAWPGNLRQLRNVLRAAVLLAGPGAELLPEHLPDELSHATRGGSAGAGQASEGGAATDAEPGAAGSLQAQELAAVRAAVQAAGGNISVAAQRLGVSRNTVYRKLRAGAAG